MYYIHAKCQHIQENEIQKKKNTQIFDEAIEANKSVEKEKPPSVAAKEVTESPTKKRSRKGKPRSNTEIILKEFTQAVKAR